MGINEYIMIGSRIKELRISKGVTQREMANKLDLSYSTYSNYENNYREPKFETIEKVAEILGVTIDYLIGSDSSEKLEKQYEIKRGVFINYLYSLGFSVETLLEPDEYPSYHCIGYNNCSEFKVVDANLFKNFQDECNKYVTYLINDLLEKSIDIEDFTENNETPDIE
jgi:transcriptional regulator with XRE-family HTH domain